MRASRCVLTMLLRYASQMNVLTSVLRYWACPALTSLSLLSTACSKDSVAIDEASRAVDSPTRKVKKMQATENDFVQAINLLAVDLYASTRSQPGNLVFSPASISIAFAMTYAGAAGKTASEMREVLHLPDGAKVHDAAGVLIDSWNAKGQGHELQVVNRLFAQKDYEFTDTYLQRAKVSYRAPVELVDFMSGAEKQRQHINQWVETQTNNRIKELIPKDTIAPDTKLVLTNAVYFLGRWAQRFSVTQTSPQEFLVGGTETVSVPMMQQIEEFSYAEAEGVQILQMPYQASDLAMTILLPSEAEGLPLLEKALSTQQIEAWVLALNTQKVHVSLPRFTLKGASLALKHALMAMGMKRAFSPDLADFSAMAKPEQVADELYIADAFHEAYVRVDEKGTEATAATAVLMAPRGAPSRPTVFRADHPFLFLIRDTKTGVILFLGRVTDPRS